MNNAILFFYNINVQNLKRINNKYHFKYLNDNYVIYPYERSIEEVVDIYILNNELLNSGLPGYEIIVTNNKDIVFLYEDNNYILMKYPNINNRIITYQDITKFNYEINRNIPKLDKSNWPIIWGNKIDFIEYQFNQMKSKYPLIDTYIDYYIGLWENAISYFNNNVSFKQKKYICHIRVSTNTDLYDFLNPLNFVVDYKERDIGEYIKSFVVKSNYSYSQIDNYLIGITRDSAILLISRILFPSYFFDTYEEIIVDKKDEYSLLDIVNKNEAILSSLNHIFNKLESLNIPYIEWIKKD